MKKRIFVLLGHPGDKSLTCFFGRQYIEGAKSSDHEVRVEHIGSLDFDPVLWEGHSEVQKLEPDLKRVQENIKWADHLVLVFPIWWGDMPGILKGMFDRMFLPGFAFKFHKSGFMWERLLKRKSARIIVTMDNFPLIQRLFFGSFTSTVKRSLLWFSGVKPVRLTSIGRVSKMSEVKKKSWQRKIRKLGEKAK